MKQILLVMLPLLAFAAGWYAGHAPAAEAGQAAKVPVPPPVRNELRAKLDAAMRGEGDRKNLAREWGSSHPRTFLQWLLKTRPQPDQKVVQEFFESWLASDPDAAFTAIRDLPARFGLSARENSFLANQLFKVFAANHTAALRWLKMEPDILLPVEMMQALNSNLKVDLSGLDPAEAARELNAARKSMVTTAITEGIAQQLAARDIKGALAWAATLVPEHRGTAMGQILQKWAAKDTPAVLAYLAGASSQIRQTQVPFVIQEYAKAHPREAITWIQEHTGDTGFYLFDVWVRKDFGEATSYALQLDNPQVKQMAIKDLALSKSMNLGTSGAPQLLTWVDSLPQENRAAALTAIMPHRDDELLPLLLEKLPTLPGESSYALEVAGLVGRTAGRQDFKLLWATVDWAVQHPGAASDVVIVETARSIRSRGSQITAPFLEKIPPGPLRDRAQNALTEK